MKEMVRLSAFPFRIGRGYHNDLILVDPFVSPRHIEIVQADDGSLEAVDLGSDNGLHRIATHTKEPRVTLTPATEIRIGHTVLRFRGPDSAIAPTIIDVLSDSAMHWLERPMPSLGLAAFGIVMGLLLSYQGYYSNADIRRWLPSAVGLLAVHLGMLLPWAGVWALISRIIKHRAQFFAHLSVASIAIIFWYVLATAHSYANFAFANEAAVSFAMQLLYFWLGTTLVYLHLQYATLGARLRTLLLSSGFASFIVGMGMLYNFSQQFDFSYDMHFPRDVKPPAFRVAGDKSVEQFVSGSNHLEADVQELLSK